MLVEITNGHHLPPVVATTRSLKQAGARASNAAERSDAGTRMECDGAPPLHGNRGAPTRIARAIDFTRSSECVPLSTLVPFALAWSLLPTGCSKDTAGAPAPNGPPVATDAGREAPSPVTDDAGGDAGPTGPPELFLSGRFARSAHVLAGGARAVVFEKPQSLRNLSARDPDRTLAWVDPDGVIRQFANPPAGHALLDATVHPSGEVTVLHASEKGFFLGRYGADRKPRAYFPIVDPAIATDPPTMAEAESTSPIEEHTHDVGRIAADGESVVLATRTGRHSVVAYRVSFDAGSAAFGIASRTLVVPAHSISPVGLIGGTYDTFGQLDAHYGVHVARGSSGIAWIAVSHARVESGAMLKAHAKVFGESLTTDPDMLDLFVTRVAPNGARLGTSVVSTANEDQLYGLRAIGDDAYAVGRTEHWNEQGTGFDALVAKIDAQGAVTSREVAIDRGDIAFDVGPAPDGGLVVVGASGYWQNPHGASISEESNAFALWIHPDGTESPLEVPNGPRHNEARFVLPLAAGALWIGGMHNGPGTHSADGSPERLRADGFATTLMPR